jgi:hypothetical protein
LILLYSLSRSESGGGAVGAECAPPAHQTRILFSPHASNFSHNKISCMRQLAPCPFMIFQSNNAMIASAPNFHVCVSDDKSAASYSNSSFITVPNKLHDTETLSWIVFVKNSYFFCIHDQISETYVPVQFMIIF